MIPTLLGGLTADQFLAEYWQKKPLLVRGALPGFSGLLSRDDLLDLSCRDDVESRFVSQTGGWTIGHGPFSRAALRRKSKPWTVLVQSLNLVLPTADELMREFGFVPYARLDDLMVSYATDGGGVGPHFDSYDVFLIQGMGKRRWRIGNQKDQTLIDGLPIRILKDFRPVHDWVLEPGDMLYLPPEWAHDGIAVGECMTYSVGFRAAPAQELAEQFLMFLQDRVQLSGRYRDPGLKRQRHPAEIGTPMIDQVADILSGIRWQRDTIRDFLGATLTEPKSHVFFDRPEKPLSERRFTAALARRGVRLDARSQLLFAGSRFYINGESVVVARQDQAAFRDLADERVLPALPISPAGQDLLYDWYRCGFVHLP
ncbi:MAG TPA: cupin domain-containing protein [Rhodocyclaceae bacterium]|nr:cupin domain-containing protein [Rhodocyclaceae bacterium]